MRIKDLRADQFRKYFEVRLQGKRLHKAGVGWMAICPFHDDRTKSLSLNLDKGIFKCHAGCGEGGIIEFEKKFTGTTDDQAAIASIADVLGESQLKIGSGSRAEVIYPYTDEQGKLLFQVVRYPGKRFIQRKPCECQQSKSRTCENKDCKSGWVYTEISKARTVLYHLQEVITAREVIVCYAPDTEVLTTRGWKYFPDISVEDHIAEFDAHRETIQFVHPKAVQQFQYSGELVLLAAEFCDLAVTPEHRVLRRAKNKAGEWHKRTVQAKECIKHGIQLPVAGVAPGNGGPTPEEARLLVAIQADGHLPKRGFQLVFNIKKARKKLRLRQLLRDCSLPHEEFSYPSCPGWTEFRVARSSVPSLAFLPNKSWPWESLLWDEVSRRAVLEEVGHWDGDFPGRLGIRYFTAEKCNADVITAMAAITGYGAICRMDSRSNRPEQREQFVVNLVPKKWRQIGKRPTIAEYSGPVYCCTVPSGFIVVRRNGKVTICGNCEGEKDADNMREWLGLPRVDQYGKYIGESVPVIDGITATTAPRGAGKWLDAFSPFLTGKKVIVLPDNDETGEKHATVIAYSTYKYAAGVKIVRLPDLPPKGDLTDFKQKNPELKAFIAEVNKTTLWKPPEREQSLFVDIVEFVKNAPREINWLVEGVIEKGANGMMIARPKAGKSFSVLDMAVALAAGQSWMTGNGTAGFYVPNQVRTTIVSREDHPNLTQWRSLKLLDGRQINIEEIREYLHINTRMQSPTMKLDDQDLVTALIRDLERHKSEFLILDVFRRLHDAEENDNTEMQKVIDTVCGIQEKVGCQIAIIHHDNKREDATLTERARGASAIAGFAEWIIGIKVVNPEEPKHLWVREMEIELKASLPPDNFHYRIIDQTPPKTGICLERVFWEPPKKSRKNKADQLAAAGQGSLPRSDGWEAKDEEAPF